MIISEIDLSLPGFEIGISGAIPDRSEWEEPAQDRAILEFVSLLTGLVLKYGGRIVHGSHPTLTPVIVKQAEDQMKRPGEKPRATLVMSELWAKTLDPLERRWFERYTEFVVVSQVGKGGPEDEETRNQSLTAMRRRLVQRMNVMVAVGGKKHASDSLIPGVAEELALARQRGMPCFVVGGLGGMASTLAKQLRVRGGDALDNGLTDKANAELLGSKDIGACVSIIFDHLARHTQLASRNLMDLTQKDKDIR